MICLLANAFRIVSNVATLFQIYINPSAFLLNEQIKMPRLFVGDEVRCSAVGLNQSLSIRYPYICSETITNVSTRDDRRRQYCFGLKQHM